MSKTPEAPATTDTKPDEGWPSLAVDDRPAPPSISQDDRAAIWQEVLADREQRALAIWKHYHVPPAQMWGERPEGWTEEDERKRIRQGMENIVAKPLKSLTWGDFGELSHLTDETTEFGEWTDQAADLWDEVKEEARHELRNGHRSAMALESRSSKPLDRARFLVLREALAEEWRPRGGVEWILIDQIAQAHTMWETWLKIGALRAGSTYTSTHEVVFQMSVWAGPPQTEAEATKTAGDEADRWHRVYVRALRQLRDLRRYNVQILNPKQVNIGQNQVNVQEAETDPAVPVPVPVQVVG